ncbi:MAG: beta-ketoacyl-ACP synthase [Treponema sp.]|nr:beta-ketoacyl-ACP synthase [Treponema sp.]
MSFTTKKGCRVVVTGCGAVSALGNDWHTALKNLKAKKNFVKYMSDWDEKYPLLNTRLAAPIDFEIDKKKYPRKQIRGMGRVAQMALVATDNALADSGLLGCEEITQGRTGVAYGSSVGSVDPIMEWYSMHVTNDTSKVGSTTYIKAMPQTCAVNLEIFYHLTGRLIPTNTACTSGSLSIGYAYETIRAGIQDIMIAGGAEEFCAINSATFDILFSTSVKNKTPELTPTAYDVHRDGLVIGEGAGTLILEEYEHAVKRGAKIYAEVVGFGTTTDGSHITSPNRTTVARAIQLAIDDAGISPNDIGYINTHGTATTAGDIAETNATYDVFKRAVPCSTVKNYIGHTLGACGAIESWLTIEMMREGWFLPNINLKEVDPKCAPLDYIMGDGREIHTDYVMNNNFAFGGINTSLIFKRV